MIEKELFGVTKAGEKVYSYHLQSPFIEAEILSYGGIIRTLCVPDSSGRKVDVVLGFDTLAEYEDHSPYFGALIGRFANRIKGGSFKINGIPYQVSQNEKENHLHGGFSGLDKKVWQGEIKGNRLILTYKSSHGEEGYPGNLTVSASYEISEENLILSFQAQSDQDTVINLTNHSYFNLSGHEKESAGHLLECGAEYFTQVDDNLVPTGAILPVAGTDLDYTKKRKLVSHLDHNYILSDPAPLKEAAIYESLDTGIVMRVLTTMPGMQIYTGTFSKGIMGKQGAIYQNKSQGVCFEAQFFPDSMNHPSFPSVILLADSIWKQEIHYCFSPSEDKSSS